MFAQIEVVESFQGVLIAQVARRAIPVEARVRDIVALVCVAGVDSRRGFPTRRSPADARGKLSNLQKGLLSQIAGSVFVTSKVPEIAVKFSVDPCNLREVASSHRMNNSQQHIIRIRQRDVPCNVFMCAGS